MVGTNRVTFYRNGKGYLYASYYASDGRVETPIGRRVTKEEWANGKVDLGTRNLIGKIEINITKFARGKDEAVEDVKKVDIENIIRSVLGKGKKAAPDSMTLKAAIKLYQDKMISGDIDNNGKPYSKSKIDQFSSILSTLADCKALAVKLDDFTFDHFQLIKKDLLSKNKSQNTLAIYTTHVKTVFFYSMDKWHTNSWWAGKKTTVAKEDIDTHIYYKAADIEKIYRTAPKFPKHEAVRDLFVFGCCIGLRDCDLNSIKDAIKDGSVLQKETKKGGKVVHVPLSALAQEIWNKYKGELPTFAKSTFRNGLRTICKDAGFTQDCLYVRTVGGKVKEYHKEKWVLTGSHTMRRSFATNAFLAGVPTVSIMKITGHSSETDFLKYIRITSEENANLMLQHQHFQ